MFSRSRPEVGSGRDPRIQPRPRTRLESGARFGSAVHAQARPRVSRGGRVVVPRVSAASARVQVALLRLLYVPRAPPQRRGDGRARTSSAAARDGVPENGPSVFIAPEVPRLRNARSRAYGSSAGTPPELSCVPLCARRERARRVLGGARVERHSLASAVIPPLSTGALELLLERRVGRVCATEQA